MSTITRGAARGVQALPFPASCLVDVDVSIILQAACSKLRPEKCLCLIQKEKKMYISLKGKEMNSEINKAD